MQPRCLGLLALELLLQPLKLQGVLRALLTEGLKFVFCLLTMLLGGRYLGFRGLPRPCNRGSLLPTLGDGRRSLTPGGLHGLLRLQTPRE